MTRVKGTVSVIVAGVVGVLASLAAVGDMVEITDGSRIHGRVQGVKGGKLTIETAFAGALVIDMAQVKALVTEEPVHVALQSGNTLLGKAGQADERLVIETPDGSMNTTVAAIVAAWRPGAENPLLPPPPKPREWKYEVSVDFAGKAGNTEKTTVGGGMKAALETDQDTLMFYVRGSSAKENGQRTEDKIAGGVDYEKRFADKHSWYARLQLEKDRIQELELRSTTAFGYGHYFMNKPDHVLRGRVGAMYLHESYEDREEDTASPGVDVGAHYMLKVSDWGQWVTDVTYTPSLEESNDYRIYHESSLDVPLARSDAWKLRLGIANEYTSLPAEDTERLDTTYFARVVCAF